MPIGHQAPVTVLLVGKGPPDRGGISASLAMLMERGLGPHHRLSLCNLTRTDALPQGGRLTTGNVRRTVEDIVAVWRAAADVDVVNVHTAAEPAVTLVRAGALAVVGRLRGCAVVVHAHGGRIRTWLTGWRRWLARLALVPAHQVVAVAEGERAALTRALGEQKVTLISNGVDVRQFSPGPGVPDSRPVPRVVYVGLLTPRKGVIDLLQASRMLADRGVEHELHLVGGTPDEGPQFEEEVRAAATSWTVIHGSVAREDMPAHYRGADVFCLPSWWESMPLSVLEAMATGLPVVATGVGDVPAMVDHEVGVVVPPRRPDALAAALEGLLTDPSRRRALGEAARRRAESEYSLDRGTAAFAELVDAIESRHRRGRRRVTR